MPSTPPSETALPLADLVALVSALQVELIGLKSRLAGAEGQVESLRETIVNLTHENAILKRRIYGNKTERTQTTEMQLTLGDLFDAEKQLKKELSEAVAKAQSADNAVDPSPSGEKVKSKPKGRRDPSAGRSFRHCASR